MIPGGRSDTALENSLLVRLALLFALNGLLLANWASRIPVIRSALGLDEAQVGAALLGLTLGTVLILPLVGRAVHRLGPRTVTTAGLLLSGAGLLGAGFAGSFAALFVALIVFGAGFGSTDVVLNHLAVGLERRAGSPVMSRLHGMFSFGALLGAAVGGLLIALLPTPVHFLIVTVLVAVVVLPATRGLGTSPSERGEGTNAPPTALRVDRAQVALCAVAFAAAVAEGAAMDWTGVYLTDTVGSSAAAAALGFGGFSLAMMLVRFAGDGLSTRAGPAMVGRFGALLALLGVLAAVAVPTFGFVLAGFTLLGVGLAVVAPLVFSAAGRHTQGGAAAIALVTGVFYAGFLAGPPLIGGLAHLLTLRVAWLLVALLFAAVALLAGWLGSDVMRGRTAVPTHADPAA